MTPFFENSALALFYILSPHLEGDPCCKKIAFEGNGGVWELSTAQSWRRMVWAMGIKLMQSIEAALES